MSRVVTFASCALLAANGFRVQPKRVQQVEAPAGFDDTFSWAAPEDRERCQLFWDACKEGNQSYCEAGCAQTRPPSVEGASDADPLFEGFAAPNMTTGIPIGDIVSVGQFVWDFIKDNRPISDIANKHVSALERDTTWTQYSGWRRVQSSRHRVIETTNVFGGTVVSVDMLMDFLAHGRLSGGGGYLKHCYASPSVDVTLTNFVEGRATAREPFNYGTVSSPCASVDIIFSFRYGSFIKSWNQDWRFTYRCNGWWGMFPL